MNEAPRSGCPINLTLEALGDRWSLIVIRDIIFGGRRHFRDLLAGSEEGIATNILADRLKRLTEAGFLVATRDPSHKQRTLYNLTDKAIDLVPLLATMGAWGLEHTASSRLLGIRARLLSAGGPALWDKLKRELRAIHVEGTSGSSTTIAELQAAYATELADN